MNKHLLFLLLIVTAIWGATRLFQPPDADTTVVQARSNATTQSSTVIPPPGPEPVEGSTRLQEKNGIEVSIDAVEQRGDTRVLTLSLNNHQFDLSDPAIYDNATLGGIPSQSHTFLGEPSGGGHHTQVEVVFPLTTEGSFTIAPAQDIVFTFTTLW